MISLTPSTATAYSVLPSEPTSMLLPARATVEAAERVYGAEDAAVDAVRDGWEQVGVKASQTRARAAAAQ
jgi:hypothetical protein